MENLDLSKMTDEQKDALRKQLAADEDTKTQLAKQRVENYKQNVSEAVEVAIKSLSDLSCILQKEKTAIYSLFMGIIKEKSKLFNVRTGQKSHTFSDKKGNTIELGWRMASRFDDTLESGLQLVRLYIDSLIANDADSKAMRALLNELILKDKKGNLDPAVILKLQSVAKDIDSDDFKRGVQIITDSYAPIPSKVFVRAIKANPDGTKVGLNLGISEAEFLPNADLDFSIFDFISVEEKEPTEKSATEEQKESPSEA